MAGTSLAALPKRRDRGGPISDLIWLRGIVPRRPGWDCGITSPACGSTRAALIEAAPCGCGGYDLGYHNRGRAAAGDVGVRAVVEWPLTAAAVPSASRTAPTAPRRPAGAGSRRSTRPRSA